MPCLICFAIGFFAWDKAIMVNKGLYVAIYVEKILSLILISPLWVAQLTFSWIHPFLQPSCFGGDVNCLFYYYYFIFFF